MVAIIRKKLIKVMNTELGIDRTLLGDQYIGQVLSVISIRFVLAGLMTLIFAMCIGQNILKVTKKTMGRRCFNGSCFNNCCLFLL